MVCEGRHLASSTRATAPFRKSPPQLMLISRPARLNCRAAGTNETVLDRIGTSMGLVAATGALTLTMACIPLSASAVSGGGGLGTSLSGKDFSGQDLKGQKFYKADMRQSNFSKANLAGANLYGAFAKGANFTGADLSGASIESVDFEDATLKDANLTGVQGTNAKFKNTNVENTDWSDAILRKDVQKQLCKIVSGTNPKTGIDAKESLLC